MASISNNDVLAPTTLCVSTNNHPYGSSIASSASSSSSSIFSLDAPSQSSTASSSTNSLNAIWEHENQDAYTTARQASKGDDAICGEPSLKLKSHNTKHAQPGVQPLCEAVAPDSRRNPRRTHRLPQLNPKNGTTAPVRPPPALIRQCERKDNFVDSLVDTTTQMIETIWPLSVLSCSRDTSVDGKDQNLIGLRTFVQEVLRRSKTSYSTLQVALYYLVLIQSCIPKHDFTMEQPEDSQTCRAMQCGRRMFLAALILASKYLQDRNFSARAWSKISGLKTFEINTNEMAFLSAVNWKLHIPEPVFNRWTDVVLKYSPSSQPSTPLKVSATSPNMWKTIIPLLTPDLDPFTFGAATISHDSGYSSPSEGIESPSLSAVPLHLKMPAYLGSTEPISTSFCAIPKVLEPVPRRTDSNEPILPPLPHLGLLPTPTMTPHAGTFCTPAASALGLGCGRSSMSIAMAQVQTNSLARSTLDNPTFWKPTLPHLPTSARRSSLAHSVSSLSSPESMLSDVSSRTSRSSSISSIASSTCALPQPPLAVQATRRCANLKLASQKENSRPFVRLSPSDESSWEGLSVSPDAVTPTEGDYFSRPPQKGFKNDLTALYALSGPHTTSAQEAAAALRNLALNRHRVLPCPSTTSSSRKREHPSTSDACDEIYVLESVGSQLSATTNSRKRERPLSKDLSVQASVRDLIASTTRGDARNNLSCGEDDSIVLNDRRLADSFMVPKETEIASFDIWSQAPRLMACSSRKRPCCVGREEVRRSNRFVATPAARSGPGMWEGII